MLPPDLTRELKSRLNILAGQLQGLVKLLDAELPTRELIQQQFQSVTKGMASAEHLLLDEVFRKGLALHLVAACPGDCPDAGITPELLWPAGIGPEEPGSSA
ncbi:hypothetical protein H8B13_20710 [Hymenobacter sp. BT188]|uniref:hypothetical protein n=1 Tax=Hymenobacter sp. BT188 TaxID=2763504 RepID=UPI0016515067|nr:hypothetical protein [Hymenobacter sp. BT188]MBC6609253.1 hypothetical protein [Hymenobacter sp. BT188]